MTRLEIYVVGLLIVLLVGAARAELTILPGAPVVLKDGTRIDLIVLNETAQPQWYVPAPTLELKVAGKLVQLKLIEAQASRELLPGQFQRVGYATDTILPEHAMIEIVPATAPTAGSVPVTPEKKPSRFTRTFVDDDYHQEAGLVEFLSYRLRPYEPMYFLIGPNQPNVKFQLSMKYQLFGNRGEDDPRGVFSPLSGLFLAYSQTSFWDWEDDSKPFFDNSYRPELFFAVDRADERWLDDNGVRVLPEWMKFGFQIGLKHESNGRDGAESRSLNIVYFRPVLTFTHDNYFLTLAPSVHAYVFGLDDANDDIEDYRGYGDLKMIVGEQGGIQLAAIGRLGDDWDKGSLQLDLSFPIRKLTADTFDIYFHVQYFTGYGESLLGFDDNDTSVRVGVSMVR